jgi:hypothetical protein
LTMAAPRFMPPRKRRHEQVILSFLDISTTKGPFICHGCHS